MIGAAAAAGVAAGGGDGPIPVFFDPVSSTKELIIAIGILALAIQTSEDLTCIAAGILVSDGFIGFWWAVVGCYIGIVAGDIGLYLLGRVFGGAALQWRPLRRLLPEHRVAHWAQGFEQRGFSLIVLSRFIPGSRVPVYFAAGMLQMVSWRFIAFLCFAAAVWVPVLVGASVWLGRQFLQWFEDHRDLAGVALIAAVIILYIAFHQGTPLFTWRGRRMALGFWRRVFRWEFWPRQVFYLPVVAGIAWLMLKYRSVTLVTAVNPGMPGGGGFLMERKSEIFESLAAAPELPAWRRFAAGTDPAEHIAALHAFMSEKELSFPVVLKPEVGYRGKNVVIAESSDEAHVYFCDHREIDVLAQEFAGGVEFGVFYLRHPDEERGRIISITEKRCPFLTGDGKTTLENLILRDDRAVSMGKMFLKRFAKQIDDVPAKGEKFPLTNLGNHCQGALFLDACDRLTPELETAMDRISRSYEGFYFGRYDVKAPTMEDFQAGRNLTILELNGLTSEATHIFDPHYRLFDAYRALMNQWREAFEIAAKNRDAGAKPIKVTRAIALIKAYLGGKW